MGWAYYPVVLLLGISTFIRKHKKKGVGRNSLGSSVHVASAADVFTELAHWANIVIESPCPSFSQYVCAIGCSFF